MQTCYQLIFRAPRPPLSQAQAVDILARLYQTSPTRIQRLLQQPQPILKRLATLAEAQKYQRALEQHGIQCSICEGLVPAKPPLPAPSEAVAAPRHAAKKLPLSVAKWQWAAAVLCLGVVAWFAGQGYQQHRIVQYNDTLVDLIERAVAGFEPLLHSLSPYGNGQAVEVQTLQAGYQQTMRDLQQAHEQIQSLSTPTVECAAFREAALGFLAYQIKEGERVKVVVDYIAAHNPGSPLDIFNLRKRLHKVGRNEAGYLQALRQTQEQMAQRFQIQLK